MGAPAEPRTDSSPGSTERAALDPAYPQADEDLELFQTPAADSLHPRGGGPAGAEAPPSERASPPGRRHLPSPRHRGAPRGVESVPRSLWLVSRAPPPRARRGPARRQGGCGPFEEPRGRALAARQEIATHPGAHQLRDARGPGRPRSAVRRDGEIPKRGPDDAARPASMQRSGDRGARGRALPARGGSRPPGTTGGSASPRAASPRRGEPGRAARNCSHDRRAGGRRPAVETRASPAPKRESERGAACEGVPWSSEAGYRGRGEGRGRKSVPTQVHPR